jgi:hypothetical protein
MFRFRKPETYGRHHQDLKFKRDSGKCCASPGLKIFLDLLFVFSYVIAARLLTALSAFQIIGGIDGLASRAGIISPDFIEPLFIPNRLDSLKIVPKLDPVNHCGRKG